jgi:hypothetical protein
VGYSRGSLDPFQALVQVINLRINVVGDDIANLAAELFGGVRNCPSEPLLASRNL